MDNADRARLKRVISDRMDELTLMLEPAGHSQMADEEAATFENTVSSGVDTAVHSLAVRELRVLRRNLEWLDSDEGGYCDECGREIRSARLMALPATRLCVDCASLREGSR